MVHSTVIAREVRGLGRSEILEYLGGGGPAGIGVIADIIPADVRIPFTFSPRDCAHAAPPCGAIHSEAFGRRGNTSSGIPSLITLDEVAPVGGE